MDEHVIGLYERWLAIERANGSLKDALADLNAKTDSNYKHNWPTLIARGNYELNRLPTNVRRYLMNKVMKDELENLGVKLDASQVEALVIKLT